MSAMKCSHLHCEREATVWVEWETTGRPRGKPLCDEHFDPDATDFWGHSRWSVVERLDREAWPNYEVLLTTASGDTHTYTYTTARGALAAVEEVTHRHANAGHSLGDVVAVECKAT